MAHDFVVHLIDDDEAVRDSITFLLKSSGFFVHSYTSASEFLNEFDSANAGCVITDVRMPDIDGLELLRRMADQQMAIPVIVITGHGDVALALEAIKAGASDFIEKPFDQAVLLGAVQAARSGLGAYAGQRREIQERLAKLSPLERQVLKGLTVAKSNSEIASMLQADSAQVEVLRASVMTKMQASSLPHLVRMLLQAGEPLS